MERNSGGPAILFWRSLEGTIKHIRGGGITLSSMLGGAAVEAIGRLSPNNPIQSRYFDTMREHGAGSCNFMTAVWLGNFHRLLPSMAL